MSHHPTMIFNRLISVHPRRASRSARATLSGIALATVAAAAFSVAACSSSGGAPTAPAAEESAPITTATTAPSVRLRNAAGAQGCPMENPFCQGFLTFGGLTQTGSWPPSSTNNQLCMDLWGDSFAPNTVIDSTYCNGTAAQYFVATPVGSAWPTQYAIQPGQSGGSGYCVTASPQNQLLLQSCGSTPDATQLWMTGTDGTWRSVAYGDCIGVAGGTGQSVHMNHAACNASGGQELWGFGHEYLIELDGKGVCLAYETVSNQELGLEVCNAGNGSSGFQLFELLKGGAILAQNSYDGSGNPGGCLGWETGSSQNGCNENLFSNVQVMFPGGFFNCLGSQIQPANQAWFFGAQQAGLYGSVYLKNFGGAECLDQCANNSTTFPNAGWTQPDLYTCGAGNAAQSWHLIFLQ